MSSHHINLFGNNCYATTPPPKRFVVSEAELKIVFFGVCTQLLHFSITESVMATGDHYALLLLCLFLNGIIATYVPKSTHLPRYADIHPLEGNVCPSSCSCELSKHTLICDGEYNEIFIEGLQTWNLWHLSLHGGLGYIPKYFEGFQELASLNLSGNSITNIGDHSLHGLGMLEAIDLSFNRIFSLSTHAFQHTRRLTTLILRSNWLYSLPENVFANLNALEYLDLSDNNLEYFSGSTFHYLISLQVLNLSHNEVSYIAPDQFGNLTLRSLLLDSNQISYMPPEIVHYMKGVEWVSIANNPIECSCAMKELLAVMQSDPMKFEGLESLSCSGSDDLIFSTVDFDDLPCGAPNVSILTTRKSVLYQQALRLDCIGDGNPQPSIVWITPWGDSFAHSLNHHADQTLHSKEKRDYKGVNLDLVTDVKVLRNGSLRIDHFRGFFAGKFTCIAVNPVASTNASIEVHVQESFPPVVIFSLFIAAGCSGGFLFFGLIVGAIKLCIRALRQKPKHPIHIVDDTSISRKEKYSDYHDFTPTKTPLNSPQSVTPIESPEKCYTPPEDHMDKGGLTAHIFETLDEVRWRLRYGAEKKMERVRCHVQSLRESGSVYMQTLKDSSSTAANRVRAGMVIGMEQMKYGVKSMKEFCGTSDMGGQTLSVISVSTDVDTQQQTEVVKNVSYV